MSLWFPLLLTYHESSLSPFNDTLGIVMNQSNVSGKRQANVGLAPNNGSEDNLQSHKKYVHSIAPW